MHNVQKFEKEHGGLTVVNFGFVPVCLFCPLFSC